MKKNIFIGVDGGATSCKVRVEDEEGNLLGQALGGPCNIRLSVDVSWQSILEAVTEALKKANISLKDSKYQFHAGLGLAGTEVPKAVQVFLSRSYPFTSVCLKSDAYAACLGAHGGKDGAIIIIGTGIIGYSIQGNETVQVCGWGFPHSDEGSGAWLGLEAVRLTLRYCDKRSAVYSPLFAAVLQKFNNNFSELVSWANEGKSTEFAQLAPFVIDYAEKKDPIAMNLMQRAGAEIDAIAEALRKKNPNQKAQLPYCLFGGIAPFLKPWLSEELRSRLVSCKNDAAFGAIIMIKNFCNKGYE